MILFQRFFLRGSLLLGEQQWLGVGYFIKKLVAGERQLNKIPDQKHLRSMSNCGGTGRRRRDQWS